MRTRVALALLLAVAGGASAQPRPARAPELSYQRVEGRNLNAFTRDGSVAAHLLIRDGPEPRIVVAFPAGNSGVGLWFDTLAVPARWTLAAPPVPVTLTDARGRPLYGIRTVATVTAARLDVKQALLTNIRYLRDYQAIAKFPPEVAATVQAGADRLRWARDRLDGAPGYLLDVQVLDGHVAGGAIVAGADGRIRLQITAATGETPLIGLSEAELLNTRAAPDRAARDALRFLSYREKFLAGSWRFDTYFGRDTLMSVRLLMPALRPAAVEAGLGAVLARLNPAGEVAHEEGIGEFAIMEHRRASERGNAPDLDYFMVDDDYMLAPVAATYLLDHADPVRACAFLAQDIANVSRPAQADTVGAALVRNLRFVRDRTRAFADRPVAANLIAFKPGRAAGQWRDSNDGVGGGRYAYDVNAVLAPAALDAAARLLAAGLLDPYLTPADRAALNDANAAAKVWRTRAAPLFRVDYPAVVATRAIERYAARTGVPAAPAVRALTGQPLVFHAISLDAGGRPVPIVNSDEGFALLLGEPSAADLDTYVTAVMRPFPAGLMTSAGLLVANPVMADASVQAKFTPAAYHGTVIWSWQQALLAAGLERQVARTDLPAATRARLVQAQAALWRVIAATRGVANSELWSWTYRDGSYRVVPFGAGRQDVDESNAAQLWSTVYLAVRPPASLRRSTGTR